MNKVDWFPPFWSYVSVEEDRGKKHVINKMIAGGDKSCKKIKQADWGNEKRTAYCVVRGNSHLN